MGCCWETQELALHESGLVRHHWNELPQQATVRSLGWVSLSLGSASDSRNMVQWLRREGQNSFEGKTLNFDVSSDRLNVHLGSQFPRSHRGCRVR